MRKSEGEERARAKHAQPHQMSGSLRPSRPGRHAGGKRERVREREEKKERKREREKKRQRVRGRE